MTQLYPCRVTRQTVGFTATNDFTLIMAVTAGNNVTVEWGDNSGQLWVADGTAKTVAHDYAAPGTYSVVISGALSAVKQLNLSSQANISVTLSEIGKLTGLTTSLNLSGLDSRLTGSLSSLSGITGLQQLYLYGSGAGTPSAITGSVSYLSGMTAMTDLLLAYSGVSGDVSTLATMTFGYLRCYVVSGGFTCSLAAFPAWGSANIQLQSSGMSSTSVDNFLINLADGCGTNGLVNLAGTNSARTAASDAAEATLLAAGWTVTVNE